MKKLLKVVVCLLMILSVLPTTLQVFAKEDVGNQKEELDKSEEISKGITERNDEEKKNLATPPEIENESNNDEILDKDEEKEEINVDNSVGSEPEKAVLEAESRISVPSATNVKAVSVGTSTVKLTWDAVNGAEGYIIYRQIGKGKFEYRYMVSGTSFIDTTAKTGEFNYYRVYPYVTVNGKREVGPSTTYTYAKPVPSSATNVKAVSTSATTVKLTWSPVSNVDGYIIYRQIGTGKFEYRYIVTGTSFTDTTAKTGEYNYYRVYPYKRVNGKQIVGLSSSYVYTKPIPTAVSNLKVSRNNYKGLTVSWKGVSNIDGYIIYRQRAGESNFSYLGITKNSYYNDNNIYDTSIYFYRVYSYKKVNGKNVVSPSTAYVYARAHDEPALKGVMSSATNFNCTYVPLKIINNGSKPVTFITTDAFLSDAYYYDYDRYLFMSTSSTGGNTNAITIQPGSSYTIYYRVKGNATYYDKYSSLKVKFKYDGLTYLTDLSVYYGYSYNVIG